MIVLLAGCSNSTRPSDVDKALNDISKRMDKHVIRCGGSLYFYANVEKGDYVYYKFRGELSKEVSETTKYSEADRLNGLQYLASISLNHVNGVYYNNNSRWSDLKKPNDLMSAGINKTNNKITVTFHTSIGSAFNLHEIVNDDVIECKELEEFYVGSAAAEAKKKKEEERKIELEIAEKKAKAQIREEAAERERQEEAGIIAPRKKGPKIDFQ